jgi:hypothetical protein
MGHNQRHGIKPRRTIRAVLLENEENGLRGSKVYGEEAAKNETDCGVFAPIEFGFSGGRREASEDPDGQVPVRSRAIHYPMTLG